MAGLAVKVPLVIDDNDGHWKLLKNHQEVAKQNLKMLLLTNPGERMMDPLFGVGLKSYLFEQNSQSTYSFIASEIRSQVVKYLPYLDILDVKFKGPEVDFDDGTYLDIKIRYKILPLDVQDSLEFVEELK